MKLSWLHNSNRSSLIVFCNGWGMDEQPFNLLGSREYDVLNLYDFRRLDEEDNLFEIVNRYDNCVLISWSMGVWAGQQLFADTGHVFQRLIAINGTLCPVDDRYGIPRTLFTNTLAGWSDLSRCKFYHRLCGGVEIEERFLAHEPQRSLKDQQAELAYYLEYANGMARDTSIYNEIVVSDKDRIVPTAHQLDFWGEGTVMHLEGSHFPFYRWECWDDLLDCVQNRCKKGYSLL